MLKVCPTVVPWTTCVIRLTDFAWHCWLSLLCLRAFPPIFSSLVQRVFAPSFVCVIQKTRLSHASNAVYSSTAQWKSWVFHLLSLQSKFWITLPCSFAAQLLFSVTSLSFRFSQGRQNIFRYYCLSASLFLGRSVIQWKDNCPLGLLECVRVVLNLLLPQFKMGSGKQHLRFKLLTSTNWVSAGRIVDSGALCALQSWGCLVTWSLYLTWLC